MTDTYNLKRFVDAQEPVFAQVLRELKAGKKRSHWMWFVFPQIHGLGQSAMAQRYAITSRAEAEAYLAHPVLGPRLEQCTRIVNRLPGASAEQVFGTVDAMKFRSSMTLFAQLATQTTIFAKALAKYFDGEPDPLTMDMLELLGSE
jgi:uncharacterized protein (DUF1810 family)